MSTWKTITLMAAKRLERENEEQIKKWIAGLSDHFPCSVYRVYLRRSTDAVQTSRGVTIPLSDAERAFRFAIARRENGWHRNGETFPVGDYQLDAINETGIVAGCHRVSWDEIERLAKQEGWI